MLPFLEEAEKVSRVRCGNAELLAVSARAFVDQTLALLDARDAQHYRYAWDSPKRKLLEQWIADIDAI